MPSKGVPESAATDGTATSSDARQKNHTSKPNHSPAKGLQDSVTQEQNKTMENKSVEKDKTEEQQGDLRNVVRTQVNVHSVQEPNNNLNKTELSASRKLVSSQTLETIPEVQGNDEPDHCDANSGLSHGNKMPQDGKMVSKETGKIVQKSEEKPKGNKIPPKKPPKPAPPVRSFSDPSSTPKKVTSSGPTRYVSSKELKQHGSPKVDTRTDGDEAVWVRQDSVASVTSTVPSVVSTGSGSMTSLKDKTGPEVSSKDSRTNSTEETDCPVQSTGVISDGGSAVSFASNQQEANAKPRVEDLVEINVDLLCEGYTQPCSSDNNCNSESQRLLGEPLPEALEDVSIQWLNSHFIYIIYIFYLSPIVTFLSIILGLQ